MLDYRKAPYLELKNYKAPKGVKAIFIPMQDGKKIRLMYWKKDKKETSGTIILQQGHNEFIEKYYETIQDLLDRNYNVVCFDWRGQGMSDHMISDINKQYIDDFKIHDEDLTYLINFFIKKNFPRPLIAFGHSMGGCLMLSSLKKHDSDFDALLLSAPMLGFKYEKLLSLISFLSFPFSKKDDYLIFSNPNMGKETPFEENDLTNDFDRYQRTLKLVRLYPQIRLWGVTNAWVRAVRLRLKEIRNDNVINNSEIKTLVFNSLQDKVVDSNKIIEIISKMKNSKIINFENCKHEILMEKDIYRKKLWNEFDEFVANL